MKKTKYLQSSLPIIVALGSRGYVGSRTPVTLGYLAQRLKPSPGSGQAGWRRAVAGSGRDSADLDPCPVPASPLLSRSHMNAKQGRKPMGPHSTSNAMSQLEKP